MDFYIDLASHAALGVDISDGVAQIENYMQLLQQQQQHENSISVKTQ